MFLPVMAIVIKHVLLAVAQSQRVPGALSHQPITPASHIGQSHRWITPIIHQKLFWREEEEAGGEDICYQVILIGHSSCARSLS